MRKFIAIVIFLGLSILIGFFLVANYFNYSDGYRVGKLVKITHKGFVFKTYEGELNVGGITGTAGAMSSMWNFSVNPYDKKIIAEIDSLSTKDAEVKVYYHEKLYQLDWLGDTKYFVYKIEPVR
jgi:hypothetical protein